MLVLKNRKTNNLARRLLNNDVGAFNTLYTEHHSAIYANSLKLVKDPAIAEDIVQDVFITLWEKRHTIDPKRDIVGWLFVISYHKTIDAVKRKLRQALAENILHSIIEEPDVFKENMTEEQLGAIEKAVGRLSPQKRKVFDLCKVQSRTYEKAAEELHISKYTVKEYLSDAIVSIKKYIGQHSSHAHIIIQVFLASQVFISL